MTDQLQDQVLTAMRPVAVAVQRTVADMAASDYAFPTRGLPELDLERCLASVEVVVDTPRLARDVVAALEGTDTLRLAEWAAAQWLQVTDPGPSHDSQFAWTPQRQLVTGFVDELLRLSQLPQQGHPALELDELTAACAHMSSMLAGGAIEAQLIAPLERFDADGPAIALDDAVRLAPFEPALRQELWSAEGWGGQSTMPLQLAEITEWRWAVVVELRSPGLLAGPDWASAQAAVDNAITALRLLGPGHVSNRRQWLRYAPEAHAFAQRLAGGAGLYGPPYFWGLAGPVSTLPGADDAARLAQLFKRLSDGAHGRLQLALRRFDSSVGRDDDQERLIDCWIGLESLMAEDGTTELSYRASLRIAALLADSPTQRRALFGALRRSYEWCSITVHGTPERTISKKGKKATQEKLGSLAASAGHAEDALRRVISRWLADDGPPSLQDLDDMILGPSTPEDP